MSIASDHSTDRIVFLHIPRSGGTTLSRIANRHYPADRRFEFDDTQLDASILDFRSLPATTASRIRLISGHVTFAIHEVVGPGLYFTVLRDPIARVSSIFHYIRRRPGHYLHPRVAHLTFSEFLESGLSLDAHNGQCRWLAGVPCSDGIGYLDDLELAWRNLSQFAAFGLTERFDESLVVFARVLGWRRLAYVRENTLAHVEISARDRAAVVKANDKDLELYSRAQALFASRLTEVPDLSSTLRALRRDRALRAPWWRLRGGLSDLKRDFLVGRGPPPAFPPRRGGFRS
jgi:hypothetical protein